MKDTKSKIKDYNQCNLKYFNSEKNTQKANDDDIKIYLINLKKYYNFFCFFLIFKQYLLINYFYLLIIYIFNIIN